ncbi:tetratricopeptide repeat protein [Streptomyces bohaiensis]|uniref:tetratricopeptide repeat protein n=1 Tax=Streptomyces bohaiensis TaxID=1431344 RepID=UPI003B7CEC23
MLVRRWKGYAEEAWAATVYLDDAVHGPQEAMKAISDQLARQGLPLNAFTKRLGELRQRQKAAEHGLPAGVGSPGAEAAAHAGLTAAGAALGVPLGVDQLARSAGQLMGQRRERRDGELLNDPVGEVTPVFVKDLTEAARDRSQVVLFFDVYEQTGPGLDRWLRDLVDERYGELPSTVVVVIAGQGKLAPAVWGEMMPHVEEVVLDSFTEDEARDLLSRKGITDEATVTAILDVSDRLPVLVDMLASHRPTGPGEVIDPAESAVERFLRWETDPARRRAILDCALPQEVDADIYRALLDPEAAAGAEAWLAKLPFVTSHGGRYRYHDVVRTQILRLQRNQSANDWTHRHTTLADHHAHQRTTLETSLPNIDERWENEQWRDHRAAEMYHRLCANPHDTRLAILDDCAHAAAESTETLTRWVRLIHRAGHDSGNTTLTERATALGNNSAEADPETALRHILTEPGLPTAARALAHLARGRTYHEGGEHNRAIADFTRAIELNPDNEQSHIRRGLAHHAAGNYELAITDLTRAIQLNPDNKLNHSWRGRTHHAAGNHDPAIADFTRAIQLEPDNALNHHERAFTHHAAGNHDLAIADFTRTIQLEPDNHVSHYRRGIAHLEAGNDDLAIADFTRAIQLEPTDVNHYRRGIAHHKAGNHDLAMVDFTRAIQLNPNNKISHHWRGIAYLEAGNHERAIVDLTRSIQLEPDDEPNHHWRGRAHHQAGNHDQAIADLTRSIQLEPGDAWNHHWRGSTHHEAGNHDQAITDLTRAIELEPDNASHHLVRGRAHHSAEDHQQAIADLTRSIQLEPDNELNHYWRGRAHHQAGNHDQAIADLTRSIELKPGDAWNHHWRGRVRHAAGLLGAAAGDFDRAVDLDPDEVQHGRWRNVVRYEVEGRGDEA